MKYLNCASGVNKQLFTKRHCFIHVSCIAGSHIEQCCITFFCTRLALAHDAKKKKTQPHFCNFYVATDGISVTE